MQDLQVGSLNLPLAACLMHVAVRKSLAKAFALNTEGFGACSAVSDSLATADFRADTARSGFRGMLSSL